MRVLHIDTGREMRGGQWQVLRLVEALVEAGHEAVLLSPRGSPLFEKAAGRGLAPRPLGIITLACEPASADLIHAHDARGHSLAAIAGRAPLVVSRRVAFAIGGNPASRWKYARADHYIAVSEHVKSGLVEAGVPADKISVVYDGVPLGEPARGGRLIVAPATADPVKGAALVREAAQIAGLEVRFSEHLEEDLRDARMFLYITHREGLGSAALLAMAAGVPVLASRVGGLQEIIEDGRSGVFTENDPEAIAAGMRLLAEDGGLLRRLGECARERVREKFSVAAMVRGTLDVYTRILSC